MAPNYTEGDDDDYDELEMTDEEEEVGPSSARGTHLVVNPLTPYRPVQYSTVYIKQLLDLGDVDLDPDYQREVVWPETKQIGLIDSLMRNFYLPPVLFAIKLDENGDEKRICIDGKQRLTSIALFMGGQIPWKPSDGPGKGKSYWYHYVDQRGLPLPKREKTAFETKGVQCAEFSQLDNNDERDLFQRVQMGMVLSPAEKLQAVSSPTSDWVHEVLKTWVEDEDKGYLAYCTDWDKTRGRKFGNMCNLIMLIAGYPEIKRVTFGVGPVMKWLQENGQPGKALKGKIERVMATYIAILRDHQALSFGVTKAKIAPIEWAFTGVVIHILQDYYSLPDLARLIGTMRIEFRQVYKEPRARGDMFLWLWSWVERQPKPQKRSRPEDFGSNGGPSKKSSLAPLAR